MVSSLITQASSGTTKRKRNANNVEGINNVRVVTPREKKSISLPPDL